MLAQPLWTDLALLQLRDPGAHAVLTGLRRLPAELREKTDTFAA